MSQNCSAKLFKKINFDADFPHNRFLVFDIMLLAQEKSLSLGTDVQIPDKYFVVNL